MEPASALVVRVDVGEGRVARQHLSKGIILARHEDLRVEVRSWGSLVVVVDTLDSIVGLTLFQEEIGIQAQEKSHIYLLLFN